MSRNRPKPRVLETHALPKAKLYLIEQSDVDVEFPYCLRIESWDLRLGVGVGEIPHKTKVEAQETIAKFVETSCTKDGDASFYESLKQSANIEVEDK